MGSGDEDIRYGWVLQQRFERAQSEHFIEHFLDDPILLNQTKRRFLLFDQLRHGRADLNLDPFSGDGRDCFQIDFVEQLAVKGEFEFLVFR